MVFNRRRTVFWGITSMLLTLSGCDGSPNGGNTLQPSSTSPVPMEGMAPEFTAISDAPQSSSNLQRFLDAQEHTYETVLRELGVGEKSTHWIWYIFPQIAGLGRSEMAKEFEIKDLEEARNYLEHPILGDRLQDCFALILKHADKSAVQILGSRIDALKLQSSATLFQKAAQASKALDDQRFQAVLDTFFGGKPSVATLNLLQG